MKKKKLHRTVKSTICAGISGDNFVYDNLIYSDVFISLYLYSID